MKVGRNLIVSFVLILVLSIYVFILSYVSKEQAERLNNAVVHTHRVIEEITNLSAVVTEFESQDQRYVITNDKTFIKDLESRKLIVFPKLEEIKKLTADNEIQQRNLQVLVKAINEKIIYQRNIFKVLEDSHDKALVLIANPEEKRLYEAIKSSLSLMLELENSLLKQRSAGYKRATDGRFLYSIGFAVLGLILLGIAFRRIYIEGVNRKIAEEEAHKSQAKYKQLIEKSSLIIFTTDLNGRFTYISDKGLELTGYAMAELAGKDFNILIPGHQKNEIAKFYLNQYRHYVKDLEEEFEIRTKNNEIKVIQLSTVLLEDNDKIIGFQSIARDITKVKYVENLIKESKMKLEQQHEEYNLRMQSVLNNIPMILYIKDLDGRYLMVNKNFNETFGISDENVIGRINGELELFKEKAEFFEGIDLRVKNTGKPIEFEEVIVTEEGVKNFLVTKFPLFDKNNDIFAISSVAKDITDMAFHRQQLIDARLKAEKAEQLQEAFLANMSHELRTPMNGIMGMSNMLLDTNLDHEQKEYAELIKKSSDALLALINDILDLSKIKAGRMELEAIDFNIKEAVQNVLQPMKVNLKKNVVINYRIANAVPDFVKGDSHKLFQILNNLLSNAVKFTEKGEIKVVVDVIEKDDEKVHIKLDVSDTGIGISEEHIKNIFESFTQAGNDTVRRFGGTGLGLAITKRLTELQNGHITVESTPAAGTVFHVEIPYTEADAKHPSTHLSAYADLNSLKAEIWNKRILIVEDNLVNQRVLTSVLQKLKVQWDIANNGKEAIGILEAGKTYDLIIMDLQMPVMDGFAAAEYIRKKLKINTPILAMTASTLRNEKLKCLDIGMNDYLAKPFSPNVLIRHIHSLVNFTNTAEKQIKREDMIEEKLFNLEYLLELEDNDYLIEMIELFFDSTSQILNELHENVKKKNWEAVSKASHKLKSGLGALQVSRMITIASAMEENAKQKINLDEICYQNKELQNQYSLVKPLIEVELAKAKKISNGFVAV